MKYYYLGKETSWRRHSHPIPAAPFKAVRVKHKSGKMVFIPIVQDDWGKKHNEFFYPGFGRIKLQGRKTYEIPLFSGKAEDWDVYIEQFGAWCLYYSINGKSYGNDCCEFQEMHEFFSICSSNVLKYPDFVDCFIRMNEIQERVINDTFNGRTLIKSEREGMMFRPSYSIMGLSFPFMADTVADDKKLESFWLSYRQKDLSFQERLTKAVTDPIYAEITTENDVFPTCMSDRIKLIYGEECNELYERALGLCGS